MRSASRTTCPPPMVIRTTGANAMRSGFAAARMAPRRDRRHTASRIWRRPGRWCAESGYDGEPVVLIGGSDVLAVSANEPGHRRSAEEDRHERGHADDRLGQRGGAARQEGPSVTGWLEPLPHQRQRRSAREPAHQPLHHHHLRRQEFPGMAVRSDWRRICGCSTSAKPIRRSRRTCWKRCIGSCGSFVPYVPLGQFKQPFLWRRQRHGRGEGQYPRLLEYREDMRRRYG